MKNRFIFILGSPRSGTTWIQKILASNQRFCSGQETEFLYSVANPIFNSFKTQVQKASQRGGTGLPAYFTEEELKNEIRILFKKMIAKCNSEKFSYFIEKTPSNSLHVELIDTIFNECFFINVIRSPFEVIESIITASYSWGKSWAPSNILKATFMWKRHFNESRRQLIEIPSSRKWEIRYEKIKENPSLEIKKLSNHFKFNLSNKEIEYMIKNSNKLIFDLNGQFKLDGNFKETIPLGFNRYIDGNNKVKRKKLNFFEKMIVWFLLKKEISLLKY